MLLSIITLNYKKPHLTLECLTSLYDQYGDEFKNGSVELLIVDNASGDDSVDVLRKEIKDNGYKNVILIPNSENAGFSAGCNLGAASARGKYFLFLNNDTVVKDKGLLAMAEYMDEHPDAAIMGGQLHNPDGSLQPSAGEFYTPLYAFALLLGLQKYGLVDKNPKTIAQVSWVKGGLFMIQSDVFKKLKGFDERIFMYTEDMELCYRAKLAGYKTYFYPHVLVQHAEQGSSSRGFAIVNIYKNLLYFYKKHRSRREYLLVKSLMKAKAGLLIGVGKVTGNKYLVETYREAIKF
jgi:GT2 family glycosyltransferase